MATIKDPLAAERPTPQPIGGQAQVQVPFMRHVSPGFGTQEAGTELTQGGNQLENAQKVEEQRINGLRAEDAFTQLRQQQLALTAGDGGFTKLQGADAATKPIWDDYNRKFNDASSVIENSLSNDQQKEAFRKRTDVARLQYQEDLLRHIGHQSDAYADEVYKGTVGVETRNATARYDSPNDIQLSIDRITHAVEDRAERYGWSADYKTAVLQGDLGKVHNAVIQQAMASGNFEYAKKWFDDHKEDIDLNTAKALEVLTRDAAQKQRAAEYTSSFIASRNDRDALDKLQTKILSDTTLDDSRQNMLWGRVATRIDVLDRRAEGMRNAQQAALEKALDQLDQNTLHGYEPSVDQLAPLISLSKDTPLWARAQQSLNLANATRQFRVATPQQQEGMISQIEAAVRKDPTKYDIRMVDAFRQIQQTQNDQRQKDPTTFMVRQGLIEPSVLDLTDPSKVGPVLQDRLTAGRQLQATQGAPLKPLTQAEQQAVSTWLQGAPVAQKQKFFADLSTATGDDHQGYSAVMAQLAPDDPVTAIAGDYAGKRRNEAAGLMLRGQSILTPPRGSDGKPDGGKLWPMPKEQDVDLQFTNLEKDAFAGRPQLRNAMHQAAKAIYAAMSADAGDASGIIDPDRFEKAFNLATGGVAKYNGKPILLPYNYPKSEFKDAVAQRVDQILTNSSGVPPENERLVSGNQPIGEGVWRQLQGEWAAANEQKRESMLELPGWQGQVFKKIKETYKPPKPGTEGEGQLDPSVTRDKLLDLPLEPIGDGRYVFRAGSGVLVDKRNKPVILDFNTAAPPLQNPVPPASSFPPSGLTEDPRR